MIGHTANRDAKIKCAEAVDHHLGEVVETARAAGFTILITADHGNLEELFTAEGKPHVSHTTNLVPLLMVDPRASDRVNLANGKLADIAPTILNLLGLKSPLP